ncbi:MAG: hypothetical protein WC595_02345 [Candidatus Nanoarchaeia archaeon]
MDKIYISLLAEVNGDQKGYDLLAGLSRYSHGIVACEGLIDKSSAASRDYFSSQLEASLAEMEKAVIKINSRFGNGVLLPTEREELKAFAFNFVGGEFDQRR